MINEHDLDAWDYYSHIYPDKPMTMNDYQRLAAETAVYSSAHRLLYPALGLAGEAGEVANKIKKMLRDNNFDREGVAAELGDVLWYVAALARDLNVDMQDLAKENLDKLYSRKERGTISGNGDNR